MESIYKLNHKHLKIVTYCRKLLHSTDLKKLIKLQMILTNSLLEARSACTDSYSRPKSLRQAWLNPVRERPIISKQVAISTL